MFRSFTKRCMRILQYACATALTKGHTPKGMMTGQSPWADTTWLCVQYAAGPRGQGIQATWRLPPFFRLQRWLAPQLVYVYKSVVQSLVSPPPTDLYTDFPPLPARAPHPSPADTAPHPSPADTAPHPSPADTTSHPSPADTTSHPSLQRTPPPTPLSSGHRLPPSLQRTPPPTPLSSGHHLPPLSSGHRLVVPAVKASTTSGSDLGSIPAFAMEHSPGLVLP